MTTWQVQTAKQRFSEVLRAAGAGEPQFITRHGDPVAVIVDIAQYRSMNRSGRPSLARFLLDAPSILEDIDLPERRVDPDRTTGLFDE